MKDFAEFLRAWADKIDPPPKPLPDPELVAGLQREAEMAVFDESFKQAVERVYRDRPTTFSRKLRAVR